MIVIIFIVTIIIIIIIMSNIDIREGAGSRGLGFLAARSKSSASCLTSAGPVLELDAAFELTTHSGDPLKTMKHV